MTRILFSGFLEGTFYFLRQRVGRIVGRRRDDVSRRWWNKNKRKKRNKIKIGFVYEISSSSAAPNGLGRLLVDAIRAKKTFDFALFLHHLP